MVIQMILNIMIIVSGTWIWKLKDGDAICNVELDWEQADNDAIEQVDKQ